MSLSSLPSRVCLLSFIVFLLSLSHAMALPLPLTPRQDGGTWEGAPLEIGHEFTVSSEADTLGMEIARLIPK